ncbi:hypothetical protein [uncultured Maricaulis sp.]|uniref:hypothetical protein n=1 Tax=uncultured Maricaulis sp. TaxID=174710 RepID=UPI0030DA4331|tara:strand:+ start:171276 stop:171599 length:324 start_codon:yes stop_codon:yes gene_type:complete
MTNTDPLKTFFEADDVPAADPGFRTAVMERVARRRLQFALARAALAGLVVFAILLLLRSLILTLVVGLSAALGEAVLVLAAIGLAAFAGHFLVTRTLPMPGWVERLL